MNASTQAVSGVNNHGRQRGEPARSGRIPAIYCPADSLPSSEVPGAVTGARVLSSRAVLILTRQEVPSERPFALPTFSGTPEALAAARAGNLKQLDELELAWLNAWGPKPTIEQDMISEDMRADGQVPIAMSIARGAGPHAETLVEWAMIKPCLWCLRRQTKRAKCTKCNGYGVIQDCWGSVYFTLEGQFVEICP